VGAFKNRNGWPCTISEVATLVKKPKKMFKQQMSFQESRAFHFHKCNVTEYVVLQVNPEVSITLVPSTNTQTDFSIGFQIIAKNNLCDQQKFMILKHFVHHNNLHKLT